MNPGFEVERVVWAEAFLLPDPDPGETKTGIAQTILDDLRALPGVASAACARAVPLSHDSMMTFGPVTPFGIGGTDAKILVERSSNRVTPGYFATMGIQVLQGREFEQRDLDEPRDALIVNQAFVERYLEGRDPIGMTLREEYRKETLTWRIIGVVADSKYSSLGEERMASFYSPLVPPDSAVNFLVRVNAPSDAILHAIEQTIRNRDSMAAVEARTMRDGLAFAFLPSRLGSVVLGSLGVLGLFLAMIGLYGMMAYVVSRRRSEIGVRMALGATQGDVVRETLRDSLAVAGIGLSIGLAISFFATQPLARFLVPDLDPHDPLSLIATALLLTAAAMAASLIPARRAARTDPMAALRHE
jgi:predicted permease